MNGKNKESIKLALPLTIQILVIVGGGIAFYFQMTNSIRADISDTKHDVIRKVDKVEDDVEDVSEDVDDIATEQKVMKQEIIDAVDIERDRRFMKHKLDCHNKKACKCDQP